MLMIKLISQSNREHSCLASVPVCKIHLFFQQYYTCDNFVQIFNNVEPDKPFQPCLTSVAMAGSLFYSGAPESFFTLVALVLPGTLK